MKVNKKVVGLFLIIGIISICISIQATPEKSAVDMAFESINSLPPNYKKAFKLFKKAAE